MPRKTSQRGTRYLIVGNSAGGIGAVEAIRQVDADGPITIVSDEPYPAYSRPEISEYLAGLTTVERMLFRPLDFYEKNAVEAILGVAASRLDLRKRRLELEDGRTLAWDRLLLATGGQPTVPPIPGADREGIFTFTTLADADRIRAALSPACLPVRQAGRAVVIGAGLIGLSLTHALVRLGVPVVIVELLDRPLANALDREAARVMERALRGAGVELVFGQTVAEVLGQPDDGRRVGGVRLQDGRQLSCDILAIAIGVTPRVELATEAGLRVNRGIIVDRRMATSHPHVYACGDAAEAFDFIHGVERVTPIWPNAYIGGRVAGLNMAGRETAYSGGTGMNALSYFGLAIVSAGLQEPGDAPGYEVLTCSDGDAAYRKVVLRDGRVAGLTFVGDIERSGIVLGLMRAGTDVSAFKEALVAPDFGLTSLPEELWRERLAPPITEAA
jgi:NAD(P)H-nitrite reductase large subunit